MADIKRKLIIIGNGFDLAHKLPTSYNSFMVWYLNQILLESKKEEPKYLNTGFYDGTGMNYHYYEDELILCNPIDFKKYRLPIIEIKNINDFIELGTYQFSIEYKSDFLKSLMNKFKETNWVDIEYEIFNQIKTHYKKEEHHEYENLNKQIEYLKSRLKEYLLSINKVDVSKIEIQYIIEEYVLNENKNNEVLVLNFNYTDTISKYKKRLFKEDFDIINIHGNLYEENDTLIFGYGDETDEHFQKLENLNHEHALTNFKSYWYFEKPDYQYLLSFIDGVNINSKDDLAPIVPPFENENITKDFEVYIIGHSCGLSDRVLLKTIFEHENCQKIHAFHYGADEKARKKDHFNKSIQISRHFTNKQLVRKKLQPFDDNLTFSKPY